VCVHSAFSQGSSQASRRPLICLAKDPGQTAKVGTLTRQGTKTPDNGAITIAQLEEGLVQMIGGPQQLW